MSVPCTAAAAAVAAGVAMGMIRSTPSDTNILQISLMVAASPWPFFSSTLMVTPAACACCSSSDWMAAAISSRLEWLVYCRMPTV